MQKNRQHRTKFEYQKLEVRNLLASVQGDFNGDGFDDLAIGSPRDIVDGIADAGAVSVIYGTASGLAAADSELWSQNSGGILGVSEEGDLFGSALAIGDIDNDGFDDLVVGVPGEQFAVGTEETGSINVIYGSAGGLTQIGDQFFSQSGAIIGQNKNGDLFGSAVAVGDFDNDGFDDVAVGIPGEDVGVSNDAGAVTIIYGTGSGLVTTGNLRFTQNTSGVGDVSQAGDQFGFSLAVGDFDNDGADDLAIGVPMEDVAAKVQAGGVNVLYGASGAGLSGTGSDFWTRNSPGVADSSQAMDRFGFSLAAGDFDNSGSDDLAIGVPFDDVGNAWDAGSVNVLYSDTNGLTSVGDSRWNQSFSQMVDSAETRDLFGYSLAAGDFDGSGRDDLAIGVPGEDIGGLLDTGAVAVMYGRASGLRLSQNQLWHEGTNFINFVPAEFDRYGASLTTGDFNGDGRSDLSIGVPMRDVGALVNSGAVGVIHGSASRLSATLIPDQVWHQGFAAVAGTARTGERFGDFGDNTVFSKYDIEIVITDTNMSEQQIEVFDEASERWSEVIFGDVPDVASVPGIGFVDDLIIEANAPVIDGVGGILGFAGPTFIRTSSSIPVAGQMSFDIADINNLEANGTFAGVILHEMGHVLGMGTIWDNLGLVTGVGGANPRYTGAGATAEYNDLFGNTETSVPVANTGGAGTRDSHWRESVFQEELMTGFAENFFMPMSRVTTASLGDIGYDVDVDAADPFFIPIVGISASNSSNNTRTVTDNTREVSNETAVPFKRAAPILMSSFDNGDDSRDRKLNRSLEVDFMPADYLRIDKAIADATDDDAEAEFRFDWLKSEIDRLRG